ncbi:MAG: DUF4358 domain-containing protein [Clostridia bacterium]|jgi:hypothetical protein|nr:DUF4358 domain-containing protein [Clostridia bacterium]
MKLFKNLVCIALVCIMAVFCFAGCKKQDEAKEDAKGFDAEASFTKLLNDVQYAEALEDRSSSSEFFFPEVPSDVEIKYFCAPSGRYVDSLIMFKAADKDELPAIKDSIDSYIGSVTAEFHTYNPAEEPKLQNAVIYENGLYVFVCITDDVAAVNNILK